MNKKVKLAIAIVILVLLFTSGVLEEIYLKNVFKELSARVEEIMRTGDENYDYRAVVELDEWWKKKHSTLELFLPHVQLTEVEATIGELKGAVAAGDYESAAALLNRILNSSNALEEMFGFRLGNIM